MSRIHEALKKAEQERAASQGGAVQASYSSVPVADPPVFSDAPPMAAPGSGTSMPAFASPFSVDALLARRWPSSPWW